MLYKKFINLGNKQVQSIWRGASSWRWRWQWRRGGSPWSGEGSSCYWL